MKDIYLSIVPSYVQHWSWWQGARELFQNAIDAGDHDILFLHNSIIITSRGGKIPVNSLLLGKSTKADDDSKIGKYGEGMKLGFLVLLREGADITMHNGKDTWKPALKYDETFQEQVLTVSIDEDANMALDDDIVTITVGNIPFEAIQQIKANFAPQLKKEIVVENYRGKAYRKDREGTACRLYINGLFVTEVQGKFKFDYDFRPEAFVLDRDRDSASPFEVKYEAARLLAGSDDVLLLAQLACENYDDLKEFAGRFNNYRRGKSSSYYDEDEGKEYTLQEKAADLFLEKNGSDAFPINSEWSDEKKRLVSKLAIQKGFVPVTVNQVLAQMLEEQFDIDEEIEHMLDFKPLDWMIAFREKHRRKMYAKAKRELDRTIEMLKITKGVE